MKDMLEDFNGILLGNKGSDWKSAIGKKVVLIKTRDYDVSRGLYKTTTITVKDVAGLNIQNEYGDWLYMTEIKQAKLIG